MHRAMAQLGNAGRPDRGRRAPRRSTPTPPIQGLADGGDVRHRPDDLPDRCVWILAMAQRRSTGDIPTCSSQPSMPCNGYLDSARCLVWPALDGPVELGRQDEAGAFRAELCDCRAEQLLGPGRRHMSPRCGSAVRRVPCYGEESTNDRNRRLLAKGDPGPCPGMLTFSPDVPRRRYSNSAPQEEACQRRPDVIARADVDPGDQMWTTRANKNQPVRPREYARCEHRVHLILDHPSRRTLRRV
jgi:hypothetical protein